VEELSELMRENLTCYAHVSNRNSTTVDFEFRNKNIKEHRKEKIEKLNDI
jgi:hypothetical protein